MRGERSEVASAEIDVLIWCEKIPFSGTRVVREAVVFSFLQTSSQLSIFSDVYKVFARRTFFQICETATLAERVLTAILNFRSHPTRSFPLQQN